MGTPYRFGGNSKGGIDCSRFVNRAYEFVYNSFLGGKTSRDIYKELTEIISTEQLKEGDFVFFKIRRRYISHIGIRSEEHTSELQSLMRISYAVFCLKKKKLTTTTTK